MFFRVNKLVRKQPACGILVRKQPACGIPVALTLLMMLTASCAKQGMPSGGPKDEMPPKVMHCRPENSTLFFEENGFSIDFDEYVVIKDADKNIIVSPPMSVKPDYRTKGRSIHVGIKDTLKPITTYIFQFKDAIADFHEGNVLPSFEYVFSTGDYIDSMSISGRVVDALACQPSEEMVSVWLFTDDSWQMLLSSFSDTSVKAPTPTYVTRCDKQGRFSFNNICPGSFFPLAIIDEDKNMKVGNSEPLAFVMDAILASVPDDSLAQTKDSVPRGFPAQTKDSVPRGFPAQTKDSVPRGFPARTKDSVPRGFPARTTSNQTMSLFVPQTDVQRVTSSGFMSPGKAQVTTMLPMKNPTVECSGEQLIWRLNPSHDTMTIWTMREKCDSMVVIVSDESGLQDTIKFRLRKKKGAQPQAKNMSIRLNGKSLPFFDTLAVLFPVPIDLSACKDVSAISVLSLADSTQIPVALVADSSLMRVNLIPAMGDSLVPSLFVQGRKYQVSIPKGFFSDIYGHPSDSLVATVPVTKVEDYGNLNITLVASTADTALIVQLMDEKNKVLQSRSALAGNRVSFPHLTPAKYKVRVIVDSNADGEWTTGDIRKMLQPEKVVYYSKTLDIRANWDFEETFEVK